MPITVATRSKARDVFTTRPLSSWVRITLEAWMSIYVLFFFCHLYRVIIDGVLDWTVDFLTAHMS
jgi:hypothetical protein